MMVLDVFDFTRLLEFSNLLDISKKSIKMILGRGKGENGKQDNKPKRSSWSLPKGSSGLHLLYGLSFWL